MFDFTKEVALEPDLQKKYDVARVFLHLVFMLAVLFVLYRILFPIVPLDFALDTPNSFKNTLVSPRIGQTGEFPPQKTVGASDTLIFNANPLGQFSKADVTLVLKEDSSNLENTSVKIRKSYQAFFYPTGESIGFKSGTLVSTPDNGSYYIVSDGKLRKFYSTDIILKLGYPKSAFVEISASDTRANEHGDNISNNNEYPDDTLFVIDGNFYQLKNQQLFQFVSARAFLSQFDATLAIVKGSDFLSRYPTSETSLGFADGTLVSSADSVFILSQGKSFPVADAQTFLTMGFDFDDVIVATNDELGAYARQKQFTRNNPHPDGTLFFDKQTNEYFLIKGKQKHPMYSDAVAKTYARQKPVLVDSKGAEKESSCILKKKLLDSNAYQCAAKLDDLTKLIGNDYQISTTFPQSAVISTINATFSTPITFNSLRNSLSTIKTKLKNR